jgi:hypothetical protein
MGVLLKAGFARHQSNYRAAVLPRRFAERDLPAARY